MHMHVSHRLCSQLGPIFHIVWPLYRGVRYFQKQWYIRIQFYCFKVCAVKLVRKESSSLKIRFSKPRSTICFPKTFLLYHRILSVCSLRQSSSFLSLLSYSWQEIQQKWMRRRKANKSCSPNDSPLLDSTETILSKSQRWNAQVKKVRIQSQVTFQPASWA